MFTEILAIAAQLSAFVVTSADLPYVALISLYQPHNPSNCTTLLHGNFVICELGSQALNRVERSGGGLHVSLLVAFCHGLFVSFCLCVIVSSALVFNYVREI